MHKLEFSTCFVHGNMKKSPSKIGLFSKIAEIAVLPDPKLWNYIALARSERSAKTVQNSYCFLMFPILVTNLCVSLFVRGVYHHLNENKLSNILFTGVLIENSASSQSDMPDWKWQPKCSTVTELFVIVETFVLPEKR